MSEQVLTLFNFTTSTMMQQTAFHDLELTPAISFHNTIASPSNKQAQSVDRVFRQLGEDG
jgi:hypothetical protein